MRVAAVLLLVRGAAAANGTRVRGHGFSFDATAVLERRALPVNGSWRVRLHARARLKKPTQLTVVECRNASVPLYADNIWGCGRRSPAALPLPRRRHPRGAFPTAAPQTHHLARLPIGSVSGSATRRRRPSSTPRCPQLA